MEKTGLSLVLSFYEIILLAALNGMIEDPYVCLVGIVNTVCRRKVI